MTDMPTFLNAIKQWHVCFTEAEAAEETRDYHAFQLAFREARRQFSVIRQGIYDGIHEQLTGPDKDYLITTTQAWESLTEKIEVWKVELKKEAEAVKHRHLQNKKSCQRLRTDSQRHRQKFTITRDIKDKRQRHG